MITLQKNAQTILKHTDLGDEELSPSEWMEKQGYDGEFGGLVFKGGEEA